MHLRAVLLPLAAFTTGLWVGVFALPATQAGFSAPANPSSAAAEQKPAAHPSTLVETVGGHPRTTRGKLDTQTPFVQTPSSKNSRDVALSRRELAARAMDLTVMVRVPGEYGSGVLIDPKGHILTAAHVVAGKAIASITSSDGTMRKARVIESDEELDLAILRTDGVTNVAPLRWSRVTEVSMGDEVYAMGAPHEMSFTLTRGIVSHVGRSFDGVRFIQTDVPINAGNSGGPLLDESGRLLGVLSFVLRDSEGLAFAIPIEYAMRRFPQIFGEFPTEASFSKWSRPLEKGSAPPENARAEERFAPVRSSNGLRSNR